MAGPLRGDGCFRRSAQHPGAEGQEASIFCRQAEIDFDIVLVSVFSREDYGGVLFQWT